jgi:hypothetical protein
LFQSHEDNNQKTKPPPPPKINTLYPQIIDLATSPRQKWQPIVLEIEISRSQWEGSTFTHDALVFSF